LGGPVKRSSAPSETPAEVFREKPQPLTNGWPWFSNPKATATIVTRGNQCPCQVRTTQQTAGMQTNCMWQRQLRFAPKSRNTDCRQMQTRKYQARHSLVNWGRQSTRHTSRVTDQRPMSLTASHELPQTPETQEVKRPNGTHLHNQVETPRGGEATPTRRNTSPAEVPPNKCKDATSRYAWLASTRSYLQPA
jgi:hypothetical protein